MNQPLDSVNEPMYNEIMRQSKSTSIWERVKGFCNHVWLMSLAPQTAERDLYRRLFANFEAQHNEQLKKHSGR